MTKQASEKNQANHVPAHAGAGAGDHEVVVTDALGRSIRLKTPGILAHFKLVEALGESAKNQMYMAMVVPLLYVAEIDSHPVRLPVNKPELERLIEKLGEAGIAAVMQGMMQHFVQLPAGVGPLSPSQQFPMHGAA